MTAGPTGPSGGAGLRVLVVDDEQPSRDELAYLLGRDGRVGEVVTVGSAAEAMRRLHEATPVDCLVLDVQMPGISGLDLAAEVTRLPAPPPVVFVTAHDQHAVDAFELRAVDYVLKPVRAERLAEAVRRVVDAREAGDRGGGSATVRVERGGVTRFLDRSEVTHVEAHGDYARLHTGEDAFLLRVPLSTLEGEWAADGFVRIHRSLLVSLPHVTELRSASGRTSVLVGPADGGVELAVARRHSRELRDLLAGRGTGG